MAKLAVIKTTQNSENVEDYLNSLPPDQKQKDSFVLLEMMRKASGEEPRMWGPSLIGFGKYRHISDSGREVEWFHIGFAPRKANISLYLSMNIKEHEEKLAKLGKHKTGQGCLYVNKLADVDLDVLKEMIDTSLRDKKG